MPVHCQLCLSCQRLSIFAHVLKFAKWREISSFSSSQLSKSCFGWVLDEFVLLIMPSQATSSDSSDVASRYSHLLQPIRDLTKNWDIDVATQLEEYLAEVRIFELYMFECFLNFVSQSLVQLCLNNLSLISRRIKYSLWFKRDRLMQFFWNRLYDLGYMYIQVQGLQAFPIFSLLDWKDQNIFWWREDHHEFCWGSPCDPRLSLCLQQEGMKA